MPPVGISTLGHEQLRPGDEDEHPVQPSPEEAAAGPGLTKEEGLGRGSQPHGDKLGETRSSVGCQVCVLLIYCFMVAQIPIHFWSYFFRGRLYEMLVPTWIQGGSPNQ